MKDRYVWTTPEGKFIALDLASGGYPYEVDDVFRAELWPSARQARQYPSTRSQREGSWILKRVTLTLSDL